MAENEIGSVVLETTVTVHRELGPGLIETVYEVALADELAERGLAVRRQAPVPAQSRRGGHENRHHAVRERTVNMEPLRSLRSLREAFVRRAVGKPVEGEQTGDRQPAAG